MRILIFVLALGPACAPKREKARAAPHLKNSGGSERLCGDEGALRNKDRQRRLLGAEEKSLLDHCLKPAGYKQRRRDCKKIAYLIEAIKKREKPVNLLIEDALSYDLSFAEHAKLSKLYIDKKCYEFE